VDDVAREAGMSISGLQRLFHAAHGASVLEFARTRRLLRAREALEQGTVSVTEAALSAGYTTSANFATAFKRQFGISPKDARRR
jgi:AraC-like DNA-binding protein